MKLLYTIKDTKADYCLEVATQSHEVEFMRNLSEAMKHNVMFSTYPADFEVIKIGDFDDKLGHIVPCFESLGTLKDLIVSNKIIHTGYEVSNA